MSLLGFTFITDDKLVMYKEKSIKAENLAKKLEDAENFIDELNKRINKKEGDIEDLKKEIEKKDKEILAIGKDLSIYKEDFSKLKESNRKIISTLRSSDEKNTNAKAELDALKEENKKLNKKINDMNQALDTEKNMNKDLKDSFNSLLQQQDRMESDIASKDNTIKELRNEVDRWKKEVVEEEPSSPKYETEDVVETAMNHENKNPTKKKSKKKK